MCSITDNVRLLSDLGQLSGHNRQLVEMTLQQVTLTVNSLASQGSPLTAQVQSVVKQEMATTQQK